MLLCIVNDEDKDDVIRVVMKNAKTGENGTFGDGRIFVTPVEEAYTISTGKSGL
jgi:nitrogen regulatory protein PII 1